MPVLSATVFDSGTTTRHFEDSVEVFPCSCGRMHVGEHGSCEYLMHTCPHPGPLALDVGTGLARCVPCGRTLEIQRV